MTSRPVRSERTRPDVLVLDGGPVGRGLRSTLGARDVEPGVDGPDRFVGARAVVVVGHQGDFTRTSGRRAVERRADLVAATTRDVLDAVVAGVEHVVAVSSAVVNGASPDRQVIQDDEGVSLVTDESLVGDLQAFEDAVVQAVSSRGSGVRATVLRPAAIVGPEVDTLVTRHFEAPRILTIRGVAREWQFVHLEDLASAVEVVVDDGLVGRLTVGALRDSAPDVLTPADVARISGMRAIDLPAGSAFGTAERLHRVGVLPSPASEMAFAVYPWTVSANSLRDAGWTSERSSEECLRVLLDQVRGRTGMAGRRVGGRDAAALGAAGAAVALLGTAALWRQARGRA